MFVWPVNKHVNCQVKDIDLQFIVAGGQEEGWKQNFNCVEIFPVYSGHVLDPCLWLWKFVEPIASLDILNRRL